MRASKLGAPKTILDEILAQKSKFLQKKYFSKIDQNQFFDMLYGKLDNLKRFKMSKNIYKWFFMTFKKIFIRYFKR